MKLGIDIGTHVARAAYLDEEGVPRPVRLREGGERFPALARQTMHGLQTGVAAERAQVGNHETTVAGCIRLMGRSGSLPAPLLARLPYAVREVGGEALCNLLYAEVRASEVYGQIVRALVDEAAAVLGQPVEEVVLTVPASAEDKFRLQARQAVEAHGIRVARLLNQPTAALLAATLPESAQHVAVVYCGGGSTDVSIARREGEDRRTVRILATVGDILLGEEDFAWAVAEQLNARFLTRAGVDIFAADGSGVAAQGLKRAAGEALETLALAPESHLVLDHGGGFGRDLVTVVTRQEVAGWLTPLLVQLETLCKRALTASKVSKKKLDAVLLIGDAAALPAVRESVARAFGKSVAALHSDNAARLAVLGAALATSDHGATIWDVTPYPLGINCYYGNEELFSPIITANTPIPTPPLGTRGAFTESYYTRFPDQTSVRLDILQYRGPRVPATFGENRVYPHECETLGSWHFEDLSPKKGQCVPFTVTFAIDADGILHLQAVETRTQHQLTAHVQRGIG